MHGSPSSRTYRPHKFNRLKLSTLSQAGDWRLCDAPLLNKGRNTLFVWLTPTLWVLASLCELTSAEVSMDKRG
jgi:hypothetical protein